MVLCVRSRTGIFTLAFTAQRNSRCVIGSFSQEEVVEEEVEEEELVTKTTTTTTTTTTVMAGLEQQQTLKQAETPPPSPVQETNEFEKGEWPGKSDREGNQEWSMSMKSHQEQCCKQERSCRKSPCTWRRSRPSDIRLGKL